MLLDMQNETAMPLPVIADISPEGIATVKMSQEILAPAVDSEGYAAFVRAVTYQFAFELLIDVEGIIIRGEPKISPALGGGARALRSLQSQQDDLIFGDLENAFPYYTDRWNTTTKRFTGFTEPSDSVE